MHHWEIALDPAHSFRHCNISTRLLCSHESLGVNQMLHDKECGSFPILFTDYIFLDIHPVGPDF